ncbi:MAG: calcineurin-like phosphoesterase C-terminal domain-containing protein [Bacteroidales bacterium]
MPGITNEVIVSAQMQWLIKDLATVDDKSAPLLSECTVIYLHKSSLDIDGNQTSSIEMVNGSQLISALQEFTNVHVLTGHTHINFNVQSGSTLIEHNTAAVSATWWWTGKSGYAGNHICKDGSPGGYGIWEIDGSEVQWYYKGSGKPADYQFRSYDLNECHITAAEYAPNSTDEALAPYAGTYANSNTGNEVLINVWGYDPEWTVEVSEGGIPLEVNRVTAKDPLHIISYEAMRLNAGAIPTSSFVTGNTSHMFKVVASAPNTTLEIKVTDRFGNIYTESMSRPKQLSYLMN